MQNQRPPLRFANVLAPALVGGLLVCGCGDGGGGSSGSGSFSTGEPRVTASVSGTLDVLPLDLPPMSVERAVSLGDCDGDGKLDVALPGGNVYRQVGEGTFQQVVTQVQWGSDPPNSEDPAELADLDGDGKLDLLVLGHVVAVLPGNGDCTFGPPMFSMGEACTTGDSPAEIQPGDFNLDGIRDYAAVCGQMDTPLTLLLGRGDGTFDLVSIPSMAIENQQTTELPVFSYFSADIDGDGIADGQLLSDDGTGWFGWGVAGSSLGFQRDDALTRIIDQLNVMSVAPLDADRDGRTDYFWSGNGGGNVLLANRGGRDLEDVAEAAGVRGEPQDGNLFHQTWTALAFDANLDGWLDVLAVRLGGDTSQPSLETPARPYLYVNQHDGTFGDVGATAEPVPLDAKGAACGDLEGDGRVSCLLSNADGSFSLLANHLQTTGGWAGVRLEGTLSDPAGLGARVSVMGDDRPLDVVIGQGVGTWEHHFAAAVLPAEGRSSLDLVVHWPSGIDQAVHAVPVGKYTVIREPKVVTIPRRVVPADGTTTITVEVDPALAGATAATIELRGAGSWAGPTSQGSGQDAGQDGKFLRTLVAPAAPGTAILDLALDGKTLAVHPQIHFE